MASSRERRHERTKKKILDVAREIIVKDGLEGLSMRLLAQKIDYSPAAIYKYFHSKQEILEAIRDEYWELVFERRSQINLADLTPPELLYQIAWAYIETAKAYPQHYLLMFNSTEGPPESVADIGMDSKLAGMIRIIKDGIQTGYFELPEGFTPEMLAMQNWITTHGMIMLKLTFMRDSGEDYDRLCEQIIRNSIRAIEKK